jgi:hypothetical protein
MKCKKCGKDYPSAYWFKEDNICIQCYKKLHPEKKKKRDKKRSKKTKKRLVRVLEKGSYSFPAVCACCLADAETTYGISTTIPYGTYMKQISINIPICKNCKNHISHWIWAIVLLVLSILGSFFLMYFSALLALGIPAALIFLFFKLRSRWIKKHPEHARPIGSPVDIYQGEERLLTFVFWNPKFAELFAGLNGGLIEK